MANLPKASVTTCWPWVGYATVPFGREMDSPIVAPGIGPDVVLLVPISSPMALISLPTIMSEEGLESGRLIPISVSPLGCDEGVESNSVGPSILPVPATAFVNRRNGGTAAVISRAKTTMAHSRRTRIIPSQPVFTVSFIILCSPYKPLNPGIINDNPFR